MKYLYRTVNLASFLVCFSFVARTQNQILVRASEGETTISRHIYGHFAEHLGRCIYGGFYVGEDNKTIPHTKGVRNDVIQALKELKIPNLRWPGGCFADTYHWKDGIGPKDKRPSMINRWWGGVSEDNSFGTHDFLDMCELLGAEPYLSANVGSGTVQELIDWEQYVNVEKGSPMSELRIENGREKPWNVKYWGIGNETWGCGGNMTAEYYANVYRQFATFLPRTTFRIASGANSRDYHWTEVLMRDIPHNMLEGVALHHYSVIDWNNKGSDTEFTEEQYFKTMKSVLFMDELIRRHSTIMDKYDPNKRVALVVDEWGGWYNVQPGTNPAFLYQQNTMRDAVLAGATLNIFNNHADRVKMANLAQTVNVLQAVILTDEEKMILTPTYHVMKMYTVHHDAKLLPISVKSNDYTFNGEKLPAIWASASVDSLGRTHVSIVNVDARNAQDVSITFFGGGYKKVTGTILRSAKLQDHNTFDNPNKIQPAAFNGARLRGDELTVSMPPFSVVVLELTK